MSKRTLRWAVFIALYVWAGRAIDLPRFWVYGAVLFAFVVYVSSATDPTLLPERFRPAGPTVDRGALAAIRVVAIAHVAVALLDIGRFHWSDTVPERLRVPAMIVFAVALALLARGMVANRFFSSAVRLQTDRGHQVVRDGPYRIVRHPGYLAMIVGIPAGGLALGSWWGFALALAYAALIARRAGIEDRFLHEHLTGYADYASEVRFRLIPGIW
jgi:protein-S-isoprenylcysteine O-methyltransferase Ste14